MESVQDLLAPEKINIPIVEDAKTGEVSVPGVEIVKIRNIDQFFQLLQLGEANRHAANTKMNTESSRSHAILTVNTTSSILSITQCLSIWITAYIYKFCNCFSIYRCYRFIFADLHMKKKKQILVNKKMFPQVEMEIMCRLSGKASYCWWILPDLSEWTNQVSFNNSEQSHSFSFLLLHFIIYGYILLATLMFKYGL